MNAGPKGNEPWWEILQAYEMLGRLVTRSVVRIPSRRTHLKLCRRSSPSST